MPRDDNMIITSDIEGPQDEDESIEAAVRRMISDTRFASPTLEFQLVTEG